ncbi:MAG TPA: Phenylacetic acid catabolic protein [Candidatus Obscuribacterales bacterium]
MDQLQHNSLIDEDQRLMARIKDGLRIKVLEETTPRYRELVTGILLQFADSQLAGATGYGECLSISPTLKDRKRLGLIVVEKLAMVEKIYSLLEAQNLQMSKYFASHPWHARVLRDARLGFHRASSDKRLNALMYPLQGWIDLGVFSYLMSSMTCLMIEDFIGSSFSPLSDLCTEFLPTEQCHEAFGQQQLSLAARSEQHSLSCQASLNYWYARVADSFGPSGSVRNVFHREFGLKKATNRDLRQRWRTSVKDGCQSLGLQLPVSHEDAPTCN